MEECKMTTAQWNINNQEEYNNVIDRQIEESEQYRKELAEKIQNDIENKDLIVRNIVEADRISSLLKLKSLILDSTIKALKLEKEELAERDESLEGLSDFELVETLINMMDDFYMTEDGDIVSDKIERNLLRKEITRRRYIQPSPIHILESPDNGEWKGGVEMKEYITILSAKVARTLLKEGYSISDIKPMRENPDRTVFIFKNEEGLYDVLNSFEK